MLNQNYFGLPMWVWIVVIGIIAYGIYQSCESPSKNSDVKTEIKEEFGQQRQAPWSPVSPMSPNAKPIIKVFNFNTEWCGWSKRFQPEWNAFMKHVANPANKLTHVRARDIKCDKESNKAICEQYDVPGYPYVIVEVNGRRKSYEGERTRNALISHVSRIKN